MNQPTLHTGLAHLLEASGVKSQYPVVEYFSAYYAGEKDVLSSGIEQLVRFRLLHSETPVLFFSFLPKAAQLTKDEFGVLQIAGTEFVQLPSSKEEILKSASNLTANSLSVGSEAWKTFAEKACKELLIKKIRKITHQFGKSETQIGNKILNPIRLTCNGIISYPDSKDEYAALLPKQFSALHDYIALPEIAELLHWCTVCPDSIITFLQNAFAFASQLHQLSQYSEQPDAEEIISLIDRVNDSFEKLQPE